jgi:hypothetical protein
MPAVSVASAMRCGSPLGGLHGLFRTHKRSAPVETVAGGLKNHLKGEGPCDAVRFTGVEREHQVPRLEFSRANRIDHGQAGDGRPACVDAPQIRFRDVSLGSRYETEPSSP